MKDDEKFDHSEEKNPAELRFENELLKLKMRAQFGTSPFTSKDMPPEVENFFLKNIFNIERAFADSNTISLFEKLGQPPTVNADDLDDKAIETAYLALEDLLTKKGIFITFPKNENYRKKYIFITEKLFKFHVDNLNMPEIMMHFNCADFEDDDDLDDE